jgi:hypothetical protein
MMLNSKLQYSLAKNKLKRELNGRPSASVRQCLEALANGVPLPEPSPVVVKEFVTEFVLLYQLTVGGWSMNFDQFEAWLQEDSGGGTRALDGASAAFVRYDCPTPPTSRVELALKLRARVVCERHMRPLVQPVWDAHYLPQLVCVLAGRVQTGYDFALHQTLKRHYPAQCCYCHGDEHDFAGALFPAAHGPFLLWLTQHHEPRCRERPCPLGNLPASLVRYVWSFVATRAHVRRRAYARALRRFVRQTAEADATASE